MRIINFLFIFSSFISLSQVDVLDYNIEIKLSDETDEIIVTEVVSVYFEKETPFFKLDLANVDKENKGMILVDKFIIENDQPVSFEHKNDQLIITTKNAIIGDTNYYKFTYSGIPKTGLIIGKNKFNERTFFGDNWPNRAHQWIACVDHPNEKAKINFTVIAPKHYECVATGTLQLKSNFDSKNNKFEFKSNELLPTKVMVIGVAEFSIDRLTSEFPFPVQSWVYKKDSDKGFSDMKVANEIIHFFIKNVGSYPFEKLYNVQSTTQFGGMENAGNIFYDENAIKGDNSMEALMAHEIAHQWFGNSASESDWCHLWLSEGFATYFTDLYWLNKYGETYFQDRLAGERKKVISFSKQYNHPVLDTTYGDLMHLLNPNSYQKGAWILHMLHEKIGDDSFWKGIKSYYNQYQFSNASTDDLQRVFENASNTDLSLFFNQWVKSYGHPIISKEMTRKRKRYHLHIEQTQENLFSFPLEIEIIYRKGLSTIKTLEISKSVEEFDFSSKKKVKKIILDPSTKLLFEPVN